MSGHPLEPDRPAMEAMGGAAIGLLADFIEGLPAAAADGRSAPGPELTALGRPPAEAPGDFATLLATFRWAAAQAVETAGPGYLAYIPGGGLFVSALAELLAGGVNRYTGLSGLAPALVAMEQGVIRWLCDEFGLPATATGLLTTGGSMANLVALVAARQARLGEELGRATLYVTEHTHHSVAKAARIAGLPARAVRAVPTSAELEMDAGTAARLVAADRARGLRPFLLVGSAGTTDTGAVDPLGALARLARAEDLWFHVDAAYGGFFQLTERGRQRLAGIELADSITLDPHKGLFLPYGTGLLLVRDGARLRAAHGRPGPGAAGPAPGYLGDHGGGAGLPDYADLGLELTREYRGLRLWLPLHLHGVGAFRRALDEKLDLAALAHGELGRTPALELPWPPRLSVVAFRHSGGDAENQRLLDRVNASGRVFLSSTRIGGRRTLRLCVLSHRTHLDRLAAALEVIRAAVAAPQPRA